MSPDNPETEGVIVNTPTVESPEPESTERPLTRSTGEWRDSAVCAQLDPELFFPEKSSNATTAKKICRSCEVRSECLSHALDNGENFGIWGGLSPKERQLLRPGAISDQEPIERRRRDDAVLELRKRGRNAPSIASTTGLNERTVYRIISKASAAQKGA